MSDRPLQEEQDTIRLPIYGEERSRIGTSYLDQTTINGFPNLYKDETTGERSVVFTKRPGLLSGQSILTATGAANHYTLHCKDNIVITQLVDIYVCAVYDSANNKTYIIQYRPITNTSIKIGEISSTAWGDCIHLTEIQQVSAGTIYPSVAVTWKKQDESTSSGWYAISDGTKFTATTLTQITNAAFPTALGTPKVITGPFQQMNGLMYIMTTDGTIYNSGNTAGTVNDITLWNSLSTILTYQSPDKGIGLYRYKHHLVAFSKNSIEFFNDDGLPPPGTPLNRTQQAFISIGAVTSKAVINVNDVLYWISYGTGNAIGLWKMDGYTPVKISRPRQDNQISTAYTTVTSSNAIDLYNITIGLKVHIGVNLVGTFSMLADLTTYGNQTSDTYKTSQVGTLAGKGGNLLYNIEDNLWWYWKVMQDTNTGIGIHPATAYPTSTSATQYTQYVLIDPVADTNTQSNARVFSISPNVALAEFAGTYVDQDPDSATGNLPVACTIQFNTANFGNENRKKINRVSLIFAVTPDVASGDANVYSISLVYTKANQIPNAGSNLLSERYLTYPKSTRRYYFNNLGMGRFWSFAVTSLSKDPFPLASLELDMDQGIR
jgi:hypothetical protein